MKAIKSSRDRALEELILQASKLRTTTALLLSNRILITTTVPVACKEAAAATTPTTNEMHLFTLMLLFLMIKTFSKL